MNNLINDPLVVMEFPLSGGEEADKTSVFRALLERKEDIENTFKNDEYLKLNLTNQELIGIKSTAYLGKMPIGDLPALDYVIANNEKYKGCNIINIGNVKMVYDHSGL